MVQDYSFSETHFWIPPPIGSHLASKFEKCPLGLISMPPEVRSLWLWMQVGCSKPCMLAWLWPRPRSKSTQRLNEVGKIANIPDLFRHWLWRLKLMVGYGSVQRGLKLVGDDRRLCSWAFLFSNVLFASLVHLSPSVCTEECWNLEFSLCVSNVCFYLLLCENKEIVCIFLQWDMHAIELIHYQAAGFWATVCKTVRPMLWDRCLSVCNVCVLWPNGWIYQDETWHAGRPQSWPHCITWWPSCPYHLVWR